MMPEALVRGYESTETSIAAWMIRHRDLLNSALCIAGCGEPAVRS